MIMLSIEGWALASARADTALVLAEQSADRSKPGAASNCRLAVWRLVSVTYPRSPR